MKRLQHGFTIVELMIAMLVIGILAGIVVNVYGAASVVTRDRTREADARAWAGYFNTYKSKYFVYPALPTGDGGGQSTSVCLGTFASSGGKCVQYNDPGVGHYIDYNALPAPSVSAQTMSNIQKIGATPLNTGGAVSGAAIGPFAYIWQTTDASSNISVTAVFLNFFESSTCPTGFQSASSLMSGDPADYAGLNSLLNSMPSNINACGLVKTFTYNPTS